MELTGGQKRSQRDVKEDQRGSEVKMLSADVGADFFEEMFHATFFHHVLIDVLIEVSIRVYCLYFTSN